MSNHVQVFRSYHLPTSIFRCELLPISAVEYGLPKILYPPNTFVFGCIEDSSSLILLIEMPNLQRTVKMCKFSFGWNILVSLFSVSWSYSLLYINIVVLSVSDDDEIDYPVKPEFYDPELDDKDEVWVQKKRGGRTSDAILNCPACFTTLCLDCQRYGLSPF